MGLTNAARLLTQGTFGPTLADINGTAAMTYEQWFAAQQAAPLSTFVPSSTDTNDWTHLWFYNAVQGPDQLRQRMAFALSEIFVVSNNGGPLQDTNNAIASYYGLLHANALGNYRDLLQAVTLSGSMGAFLAMMGNDKPNEDAGVHADENYARELMQLFSIGLVMLNPDGTPQVDASGNPIPTYSQADVTNLANALTGWGSQPISHPYGESSWLYDWDLQDPLVPYDCTGAEAQPCTDHHDTDAKTIVGGVVIPAGGTATSDLKVVLDTLAAHPNAGPFLSKQLIERLVTSNPSPAYVQRVASVFANNGSGVRGDLFAVAKAILTDAEATSPPSSSAGKLREPLLRLTHVWRALAGVDAAQLFNPWEIVGEGFSTFREAPLASPSVFNFFRPDYLPPALMGSLGLYGPEFQITNEYSLITTGNQLNAEDYQFIDSVGNIATWAAGNRDNSSPPGSVFLHTAAWEPLASNPSDLISTLNLVFMQNRMSSQMQSTLMSYVSAMPSTGTVNGVLAAASRVIEAMDLVVNSPQYAVQQ